MAVIFMYIVHRYGAMASLIDMSSDAIVEVCISGKDGRNERGGADGAEEKAAQLPREVFLPRLLWRLL